MPRPDMPRPADTDADTDNADAQPALLSLPEGSDSESGAWAVQPSLPPEVLPSLAPPLLTLGVDPGRREGAGVLLLPQPPGHPIPVGAFAWKCLHPSKALLDDPRLILRWFVDDAALPPLPPEPPDAPARPLFVPSGEIVADCPFQVGRQIATVLFASRLPFRLVIEATYVGKDKHEALESARWTGAFMGPLEAASKRAALVTEAASWRSVFQIPVRTKREIAKPMTVRAIKHRLPQFDSYLLAFADRIGVSQHLYDAAGIAIYGAGRPDPKPRLKPEKARPLFTTGRSA